MTSPSPSHNLFDFASSKASRLSSKTWAREVMLWINVIGLPVICILLIGAMLGTVDWQLQVVLLVCAVVFVLGWLAVIVHFIEPKLFPKDEWVTNRLKHRHRE